MSAECLVNSIRTPEIPPQNPPPPPPAQPRPGGAAQDGGAHVLLHSLPGVAPLREEPLGAVRPAAFSLSSHVLGSMPKRQHLLEAGRDSGGAWWGRASLGPSLQDSWGPSGGGGLNRVRKGRMNMSRTFNPPSPHAPCSHAGSMRPRAGAGWSRPVLHRVLHT